MPSILGANEIKATGYDVANSARFNDGSSDNLQKTYGTPTNSKIFGLSWWVKLGKAWDNSGSQDFWGERAGSNDRVFMGINADGTFQYFEKDGGSTVLDIKTNRLFRDISAWYHFLLLGDSTQGTNSNRLKLYVNGVQETSLSTASYPAEDYTFRLAINTTKYFGRVGLGGSLSTNYYDGYLAEAVFVDGTVTTNTDYGEFDSDSPNIWKPIDVSGLTFGNNGFHLDFEDSSALGNDVSGNNNDFTVNNLTSVDQSTDTCTNNFCTLNPLYKQDHAFSEGNLGYTSSDSDWDSAPGTIAVSSGKWYVEMKITGTASGVTRSVLGLCDERDGNIVAESEFGLTNNVVGDNVGYGNGDVHKNNAADSGSFSTFGINDILGMYVDLDNGKVYFSKNGTMQNSGDPTSGSTGTGAISITTGATYLFGATGYGGGASQMNFGSPPYAVSSGNADPNGYGNFEYGTQNYYALNTKNLAEYG